MMSLVIFIFYFFYYFVLQLQAIVMTMAVSNRDICLIKLSVFLWCEHGRLLILRHMAYRAPLPKYN